MDNEGSMAIAIIGYVVALISPLIGLIYGAALFFLKKEVPLYYKHGKLIIVFSIVVFMISWIVRMLFFAF